MLGKVNWLELFYIHIINYDSKAPKKAKVKTTGQKLQVEVEKAIRKGIEDEMRARASQDGKQIATSNDSKASSSKCKK